MISLNRINRLTQNIIQMGEIALKLGKVKRATKHPDLNPESDTTHTCMLSWIATYLADQEFYSQLNIEQVALLSLAHDAIEAFCGDTPTLGISDNELATKKLKEINALEKLQSKSHYLYGLAKIYELQNTPEARFVKAVDKLMPKITHYLNSGHVLIYDYKMSEMEFIELMNRQRETVNGFKEFDLLFDIHKYLTNLIVDKCYKNLKGT